MGRYMESYGIIKGVCMGLGIPYTPIAPRTWKAKMMRDMPKEKGSSIVRVQQLFPDINLPLKRHHNIADSILICLYGLKAMEDIL